MDLIIEWSDEPLNLAAIRAILRDALSDQGRADQTGDGEVMTGERGKIEERPLSPGGDLPEGLLR